MRCQLCKCGEGKHIAVFPYPMNEYVTESLILRMCGGCLISTLGNGEIIFKGWLE